MTDANSQELKGYQSQLAKARADAEAAYYLVSAAQRAHACAEVHVKSLEAKIIDLQKASGEPIVSEQAMLRWLERNGVSLDAVRAAILGDGTAANIKFMGSGKVTKGEFTLIVKNNTVVTVE